MLRTPSVWTPLLLLTPDTQLKNVRCMLDRGGRRCICRRRGQRRLKNRFTIFQPPPNYVDHTSWRKHGRPTHAPPPLCSTGVDGAASGGWLQAPGPPGLCRGRKRVRERGSEREREPTKHRQLLRERGGRAVCQRWGGRASSRSTLLVPEVPCQGYGWGSRV